MEFRMPAPLSRPAHSAVATIPKKTSINDLRAHQEEHQLGSDFDIGTIAGCASCKVRTSSAFCNLSHNVLSELERLSFAVSYPEHTILFEAEQPCRGAFILCSGKVKISARSPERTHASRSRAWGNPGAEFDHLRATL